MSAAIHSLLERARRGQLVGTTNLQFWKGYEKALLDLLGGTGQLLAEKDARESSGAKAQSVLASAPAALAVAAHALTGADVQKVNATLAVQLATDRVAKLDVIVAEQLDDGVLTVVNARDHDHAAQQVDGVDVALHGAIVPEGGAS